MAPDGAPPLPRVRARSWLRWALPTAAVALFLLPLVSPVVIYPKWDEFIVAFDAQRLLNGQVPYRDFFNFIPPGVFYFLAAAAAPFGKVTITLARYASLLVVLVNWLLLRMALERAGWGRRRALLLSLVYPVCLYPFWPVASHHWLVHLACMAFLLVAAREGAPGRRSAALLGLCAGVAGVVLQTEGLYLALGGLCLVLLAHRGGHLAKSLAAWASGVTVPLVLAFGPLLLMGAGPPMVRDILLWPAHNYSRGGNDNARPLLEDVPVRLGAIWSGVQRGGEGWRALPLALAGSLLYALLLAAVVATVVGALWVLTRALRRRAFDHPLAATAALVTALALGLYMRGRPDWLRLVYLAALLLALWLVAAARAGLPERARRLVVASGVLLLATGAIYQGRWVWYHRPSPWELADVDRPIRESAVNRWLRSPGVLSPGDTVAAFPEGGEVYLYGAPPAVGYTFFMPLSDGYNSLRDHAIVAEQIRENRCRWVLMPRDMERDYLDPASPVGALLRRAYRSAGTVGNAAVYERSGRP